MPTIKELAQRKDLFAPGHRACAGCGGSIVIRQVLLVAGEKTICSICTGCMEVVSTIFPYTAWKVSFMHSAFENSAATIAGIEAAYRALKRRGKIKEKYNFIAFGGDGGTYDIGFQALSGAVERGHRFLYICYDNQAYMNTGIQRSSATPIGAHTTTSPAGDVIPGKLQRRKNLTEIMVAHNIPYVAQATPANWADFTRKVEKALNTDGPTFINVLAPCPLGWGFPPSQTIEMARLAVECKFWPIYEVIDGEYKLNYKPKKEVKVEEWIKLQRRFAHLFRDEFKHIIEKLQQEVDEDWEKLLSKCK